MHSQPPTQEFRQPAQGRGCFSYFLAALCVLWAVMVGLVCGVISYFAAEPYGVETIGSSVVGGVTASVIVFLCVPAGAAINLLVLAPVESVTLRTVGTLLLIPLGLFLQLHLVASMAILSAIGGVILILSCEPFWASVIAAIVFPILGLVFGIIWVVNDSTS